MASLEESGQLLIELSDAEENRKKEVHRFSTGLVSQGTKTPVGVQVSALPMMVGSNVKGKRIVVSFIADATDIIESEESDFTIPVNYYSEQNHQLAFTKDVKLAQFTGFTPTGTVDVVATANVPARLCYLDAPVGYLIGLGAGRKYHAYMGDDTA